MRAGKLRKLPTRPCHPSRPRHSSTSNLFHVQSLPLILSSLLLSSTSTLFHSYSGLCAAAATLPRGAATRNRRGCGRGRPQPQPAPESYLARRGGRPAPADPAATPLSSSADMSEAPVWQRVTYSSVQIGFRSPMIMRNPSQTVSECAVLPKQDLTSRRRNSKALPCPREAAMNGGELDCLPQYRPQY